MTRLHRTPLATLDKIGLAVKAIVGREHSTVTALSEEYEVSRPTIYRARDAVQSVLEGHFEKSAEDDAVMVHVDRPQIERTVVALRLEGQNSLRDIEALIPIIYPGITISFGSIQAILVRAQILAHQYNEQVDLSAIQYAALDEMFSQGAPVLAGIDLDSSYLFSLALRDSRGGDDWADVLRQAASQQLKLSVVVKDAAQGIAAGVKAIFPDAEQRDDCFHAWLAISRLHQALENKAYTAISTEAEVERRYQAGVASGGDDRASLAQRLVHKRQACAQAIEHVECCEQAMELVSDAFSFVDLSTGSLYSAKDAAEKLELAALLLGSISHHRAPKVAKYLHNRTPGLTLATDALHQKLMALTQSTSESDLSLACRVARLIEEIRKPHRPARIRAYQRQLIGAFHMLRQRLGQENAEHLLDTVRQLLTQRYRASSAIEGFNAALRPYLYVHKRVTQGFLDLFRAYRNLRNRHWGRHKNTSAHECITGQPVQDWLTVLGFPPSQILH